MGVLPPLSENAWQAAFEKYQAIPQYRAMNAGMSLDEFRTIYWWEWTHRLLGRVIGAAYLLPFLFFLWRGWVAPSLRPLLWFIFGLGALQGAVGWWMVASGLADRVEVSHYRLATHLLLACLIYVALVWTAFVLRRETGEGNDAQRAGGGAATWRIRAGAFGLLVLILAQIFLGALVAGLRAGYAYNTWPLIDGALVPNAGQLFFITPLWRNVFENILTVQFDHRMLAYMIFVVALLHAIDVARTAKEAPAAHRRAGVVRGRRGADRARHRDAFMGRAAAARTRPPGNGDAGAHRGDSTCGLRHSGAERSEEPGIHSHGRCRTIVEENQLKRKWLWIPGSRHWRAPE